MKVVISVLLFYTFLNSITSQYCKNKAGVNLNWWVIMKVPPKVGQSGFGYYDSTYSTGVFQYFSNLVDEGTTPLTLTLAQINENNLQGVAWNDEKPNGTTSSTLAHSKGFISYSASKQRGFLISHSLPKYPDFINHKINMTIAPGQNVYGQHIICISMNVSLLNQLASKLMIIRPFIYESNIINSSSTNYLADLAASKTNNITEKFQTAEFSPDGSFKLRSIFKNGFQNSSIFEDGLISYLKQNITAETWGRPLDPAWCSSNQKVNNVLQVNLSTIIWKETNDHSKWALAGSLFACFGDMNRMSSQWKRGGSFYCFDQPTLVTAVRRMIVSEDNCNMIEMKE